MNTAAKLLEQIVNSRLLTEMSADSAKDISDRQYGFRRGKSTIDALERIKRIAEEANTGNRRSRDLCLMITVDVKNAFNSAPWEGIVTALLRKSIPEYLINFMRSYFTGRTLQIEDKETSLSRGVPQGSILGPTLWNIYYDGVLTLEYPAGTEAVGYADDLALVIRGRNEEELKRRTNMALEEVQSWMTEHGLTLCPEKTEAVILVGRRQIASVSISMSDTTILTCKALKYLGVVIDHNARWTKHVTTIAAKAENVIRKLGRIMPRTYGPGTGTRAILASVVYSVILYAAPVWRKALEFKKYIKILERAQRKLMILLGRSYRTASTEALQVVTSSIPVDLLVEERTAVHMKTPKNEAREQTMRKWQERWRQNNGRAIWTKKVLPDVKAWTQRKHGELTFHLTQMLTGHGVFNSYLKKIKKNDDDDNCWFCLTERDTPEHTLTACPAWEEIRKKCTAEKKIDIFTWMLHSEENWATGEETITKIMKAKEAEGRKREHTTNDDESQNRNN